MSVPYTFVIEQPKVLSYLLNLQHPHGASKARFFIGHGFRVHEPTDLASALLNHARLGWPGVEKSGRYGPLHEIKAKLPTPNGTEPVVCSVWEVRADDCAWLVTAYPA